MQDNSLNEDEKMAAILRMEKYYGPSKSPQVIKSRDDYKMLKLTEAFAEIDANNNGLIEFDELIDYITKKTQEILNDNSYKLTPLEEENLKIFYDNMNEDKSSAVDM